MYFLNSHKLSPREGRVCWSKQVARWAQMDGGHVDTTSGWEMLNAKPYCKGYGPREVSSLLKEQSPQRATHKTSDESGDSVRSRELDHSQVGSPVSIGLADLAGLLGTGHRALQKVSLVTCSCRKRRKDIFLVFPFPRVIAIDPLHAQVPEFGFTVVWDWGTQAGRGPLHRS